MEKFYFLNFSGDPKFDVIKNQIEFEFNTNSYNEITVKLMRNGKELTEEELQFMNIYVSVNLADTQHWYKFLYLMYKFSYNGTNSVDIICDEDLTANQLFFAKKLINNVNPHVHFATTNENNISVEILDIPFLRAIIDNAK